MIIELTVNGEQRAAHVTGSESLLAVLRDELGLPGSKNACEEGECGSCSVVMDGDLVCSCLVMGADAMGADITTVEGVATGSEELHPVQQAMIDHGGVQCGFCTPGFVVAIAHLLETTAKPSRDDVREALSGNLCRCTGYGGIERAVAALVEGDPV